MNQHEATSPDTRAAVEDPRVLDSLIARHVGDAIIVVSPERKVIYANTMARRMLSLPAGDLSLANCCDILRMSICDGECPSRRLADGSDVTYDYFVCRDGGDGVYCVTSSALCDARGERAGVIHSIKSMEMLREIIDEQRRTQEDLRMGRLRMQAILESVADGVFSVDTDRRITHFGPSMEAITGWKEAEVLGRDCGEVLRGDVCESDCPVSWSLRRGERVEKSSRSITDREGRRVPVFLTTSLLRGEDGPVGAVCTVHDRSEVEELRRQLEAGRAFPEIVGAGHRMRRLFNLIESISDCEATVLVEGETGTGKELVSRAIHGRSGRSGGPFVAVNCSALSPYLLESELFGHVRGAFTGAVKDRGGKFEAADGGTLFLDEVSEIPAETQVKLLRFLQSREFERVGESSTRKVDVRVVAASNRGLKELVAAGAFRSDLFYRLNVIPVRVPPLRERREDLPLLVEHFIQKHRGAHGRAEGLSTRALRNLIEYRWPGNVRELENAVMYALAACPGSLIERAHLPPDLRRLPPEEERGPAAAEPVDPAAIERSRLLRALADHNWKVTAAAHALGYSRVTLWRRMRAMGISRPVGSSS